MLFCTWSIVKQNQFWQKLQKRINVICSNFTGLDPMEQFHSRNSSCASRNTESSQAALVLSQLTVSHLLFLLEQDIVQVISQEETFIPLPRIIICKLINELVQQDHYTYKPFLSSFLKHHVQKNYCIYLYGCQTGKEKLRYLPLWMPD